MTSSAAAASTTSGWPWMQGVAAPRALTDPPAPPVDDKDDRPAVADLIRRHETDIRHVRDAALRDHPLYDAAKHDDLWILRFLLSHKNKVEAAAKAASYTLHFREQHQLDAKGDLRFLTPFGPELAKKINPKILDFLEYCAPDTFRFVVPDDGQRGVLAFIQVHGRQQHDLVKNLDESYWLPCFIMVAEWSHQWLDYVTRTTGRLTKSVRIVDASQLGLRSMNKECSRRDGATMAQMEDCYPQLLQTLFICNAPRVIHGLWRVLRPLLPKRVVAKMDILNPVKNGKERQKLLKYMSAKDLPARYGGQNEVWPIENNIPVVSAISATTTTSISDTYVIDDEDDEDDLD